jgi:hypothetical protein
MQKLGNLLLYVRVYFSGLGVVDEPVRKEGGGLVQSGENLSSWVPLSRLCRWVLSLYVLFCEMCVRLHLPANTWDTLPLSAAQMREHIYTAPFL